MFHRTEEKLEYIFVLCLIKGNSYGQKMFESVPDLLF